MLSAQSGAVQCSERRFCRVSDHVFGNLAAGRRRIHAQRQGELNVFPLGEIIQPGQELRDLLLRDLSEHFREVVNEHMGDVVVAGMQTAEEAPAEEKAE